MLIRIAGLVSVEEDGGTRQLSGAQAQVALARLTLERAHGTSRHELADTIWPQGLPDTWASALRSVISRVRAFVGPDGGAEGGLIATGGRYVLSLPADVRVDVECAEQAVTRARDAVAERAFERAHRCATAGLAFLRSPILPGHDGEWVDSLREHGHELLVSGLEIASMSASALSDGHGAIGFAELAIRTAPLRESAHRCLMAAHAAAGNRAEALRSYHNLRRTIAEELGTDPSPETQAVYVDLLGGSAAGARRDTGRRPQESPLTAPFAGRRAELAELAAAWRCADNGAGHMVLTSGEPGIGKTRLVTEAAKKVHAAGGFVLLGRCGHGHALPYQPFVHALADFLATTPADALPTLDAASRRALAAGLRPDDEHGTHRGELLHSLIDLLVSIARHRPVLFVMDDLHLADHDSLVLLRSLFRRYGSTLPMLLVATVDQPTLGHQHQAAVQDIDREGLLRRMPVPGLTEADIRELIGQLRIDVPDSLPRQLLADTMGNAYLVLELVQRNAAAGRVTPGIREYLTTRLAGLSAEAGSLLRVASVYWPGFDMDLVAEAAGLTEADAMDAMAALIAHGLVTDFVDDPGRALCSRRYRFVHGVLRDAVQQDVSESHRRWLHARFPASAAAGSTTEIAEAGVTGVSATHRPEPQRAFVPAVTR